MGAYSETKLNPKIFIWDYCHLQLRGKKGRARKQRKVTCITEPTSCDFPKLPMKIEFIILITGDRNRVSKLLS